MMNQFANCIVGFIVLFSLVTCTSAPEFGDNLTISDILARVDDTYANLDSYQDRGQVTTYISGSNTIFFSEKPFTTAFIRPDKFRFEYRELPNSIVRVARLGYIVWQDGAELAKYFHARPDDRSLDSLQQGLAGATGVSGGVANLIPSLFLPEPTIGRKITGMQNPLREADQDYSGRDCFVIAGGTATNSVRLWVDMQEFLIRKVERYREIESDQNQQLESLSITVYEPILNRPIDSSFLRLNAPSVIRAL